MKAKDDYFPSASASDEEDFFEERRLMYVAVTRAKKNLFLTSFGGSAYDNEHSIMELNCFVNQRRDLLNIQDESPNKPMHSELRSLVDSINEE